MISKSISIALKFPPKGQFMLFTGADKYCWRDCRECEKSREQVGRDLVEKVKLDNSAIFTFSTLALLRKRERTIHHFQFRNMGLVEKVNEDYSTTVTFSTWALLNVKKAREDARFCRELIREQEGLGPVIRLIASTSPGTPCQPPPRQAQLVKHHLVNPHLAKPTLSSPTSPFLDFA